MLVPRNVGRAFAIDQQSNRKIAPKISGALHDHAASWSTWRRARLRFRFSKKSRKCLRVVGCYEHHCDQKTSELSHFQEHPTFSQRAPINKLTIEASLARL